MLDTKWCRDCEGQGRVDTGEDERTCPECEGDGLSAEGKAKAKIADEASHAVWMAGTTHKAQDLIRAGRYSAAAFELRQLAKRLEQAASMLDARKEERAA